jgi:hypothetical protein
MSPAITDFLIGSDLAKAATDGGFRLGPEPVGGHPGWLVFRSTTVPGLLFLAAESSKGPWLLAVSRPAVGRVLGADGSVPGPGAARLIVPSLAGLYAKIGEAWRVSREVPDDPLAEFEAATTGLPRTTEAERLTIQRIGQDIFRDRLMTEWGGRCPLTGITDMALLRASHIVRWADCGTDAERLDPQNGLLLSSLWDAAFDQHLVSFDDGGRPLYSNALSIAAKAILTPSVALPLTQGRRDRLSRHRRTAGMVSRGMV